MADEADLFTRALFRQIPSGLTIDAFKKHVGDTGCPETFSTISTAKPPADTRLVVLDEFSGPRGKRAGGNLMPCPICSPTSPKYRHGALVWCEATAAIYAIGLECGGALWDRGLIDRELASFRKRKEQRQAEDALIDLTPTVPGLRSWIEHHVGLADRLDSMMTNFAKQVPSVHRALCSAAKDDRQLRVVVAGNFASIGRLSGAEFLRPGRRFANQLRKLDAELSGCDFGVDAFECLSRIAELEPEQSATLLKTLRLTRNRLRALYDIMVDAVEFLSAQNFALLASWGAHPDAQVSFQAPRSSQSLCIVSRESVWRADLAQIDAPHPLFANS